MSVPLISFGKTNFQVNTRERPGNRYHSMRILIEGLHGSGIEKVIFCKPMNISDPNSLVARYSKALISISTPEQKEKGILELLEVANAGLVEAQIECAISLWDGLNGFDKDRERALGYFKMAADNAPESQKKCNDLVYATYHLEANKSLESIADYLEPYLREGIEPALLLRTQFAVRDRSPDAIQLLKEDIQRGNDFLLPALGIEYLRSDDLSLREMALPLLLKDLSVPETKWAIGKCHEKGYGTQINLKKALMWYLDTAKMGDIHAHAKLAEIYATGVCGTTDVSKAIKHALKAYRGGFAYIPLHANILRMFFALNDPELISRQELFEISLKGDEAGNSFCTYCVGYCYEHGISCTADNAKSKEYYKKAAQSGDRRALAKMAHIYLLQGDTKQAAQAYNASIKEELILVEFDGEVCEVLGNYCLLKQDWQGALRHFKKGSELQSVRSQIQAAILLHEGKGQKANPKQAIEQLKKLSKKDPAAKAYLNKLKNQPKKQKQRKQAELIEPKAFTLSERADSGDPEAQLEYALCLLEGEGYPQNEKEAVQYLHKAAENENWDAYYWLGECYDEHRGVPRDYLKAEKYYEIGAEHNDPWAMNALGYIRKYVLFKDKGKVMECFLTAAKLGNAFAMNNLGICYLESSNSDWAADRGLEWFTQSVKLGCTQAMFNAGKWYETIGNNRKEAIKYYSMAAERGHQRSEERLKYLGEL